VRTQSRRAVFSTPKIRRPDLRPLYMYSGCAACYSKLQVYIQVSTAPAYRGLIICRSTLSHHRLHAVFPFPSFFPSFPLPIFPPYPSSISHRPFLPSPNSFRSGQITSANMSLPSPPSAAAGAESKPSNPVADSNGSALAPAAPQLPLKSWRKKYRKLRMRFATVMDDSNAFFKEEKRALALARRLQEENE
jgi:hypothetical protein